jgi:FixJ family two-component response regulator
MPMSTVCIVDDDASVGKALQRLLRSTGLSARTFSSAQEYLDCYDPRAPGCLVLDLEMPGLSGLELQEALIAMGGAPAIVFLTGRAEVADCAKAMRLGAVDFLTKPVNDDRLVAAVKEAIERDRVDRSQRALVGGIAARVATLSRRESQVLRQVVTGRLNKQIAADMGLGEKTVKVYRGRVMRKMEVRSVAQLVQIHLRYADATKHPEAT